MGFRVRSVPIRNLGRLNRCVRCPNAGMSVAFAITNAMALYIFAIVMAKLARKKLSDNERVAHESTEPEGEPGGQAPSLVTSSFKILVTHATIINAISPVAWEWEGDVKDTMSAPRAPSGSIT